MNHDRRNDCCQNPIWFDTRHDWCVLKMFRTCWAVRDAYNECCRMNRCDIVKGTCIGSDVDLVDDIINVASERRVIWIFVAVSEKFRLLYNLQMNVSHECGSRTTHRRDLHHDIIGPKYYYYYYYYFVPDARWSSNSMVLIFIDFYLGLCAVSRPYCLLH